MDRPRSRLSSSIDSLSDLLRQYWLSPLLEFTPSEIVPEDVLHAMASGPSPQQTYDQWVEYQKKKSKEVQQWYFGEAAAHHQRMAEYFESVSRETSAGRISQREMPMPRKSWISDPMMIMLCRKDPIGPTMIIQNPQQTEPLSQKQYPEYQHGEQNRGTGEFVGAAGHGGSSHMSYNSVSGPYGPGGLGGNGFGPRQYLSVPRVDQGHRNWPEEDYED